MSRSDVWLNKQMVRQSQIYFQTIYSIVHNMLHISASYKAIISHKNIRENKIFVYKIMLINFEPIFHQYRKKSMWIFVRLILQWYYLANMFSGLVKTKVTIVHIEFYLKTLRLLQFFHDNEKYLVL